MADVLFRPAGRQRATVVQLAGMGLRLACGVNGPEGALFPLGFGLGP